MKLNSFILVLFLFVIHSHADVLSTTDQIKFDSNDNGQHEMVLDNTGLGIGINLTPTANLHVSGNSIISGQMSVGGSTGQSNLNINGSLGFSSQDVSDNVILGGTSYIFADASSGNIILTLPASESYLGRVYVIKKVSLDDGSLV